MRTLSAVDGCDRDGEALVHELEPETDVAGPSDGRAVTGYSIPKHTPVKKLFLRVSFPFAKTHISQEKVVRARVNIGESRRQHSRRTERRPLQKEK